MSSGLPSEISRWRQMAMYHDWVEESAHDFSQFFIDQRYQGKGFGYEAAKLVLERMKQDGKYDKVCLCYIAGDDAARKLYEKLGFHHTGEDTRMRSSWKLVSGNLRFVTIPVGKKSRKLTLQRQIHFHQ